MSAAPPQQQQHRRLSQLARHMTIMGPPPPLTQQQQQQQRQVLAASSSFSPTHMSHQCHHQQRVQRVDGAALPGMHMWFDVMRDIEHVMDDYENVFDGWVRGGVTGLVLGPLTFDSPDLGK
jgi:hypothetical protein